ncbi:MAG: NHL repeat-containing protein, partial [Pirellulaceae bacterium]|nr:NHL repeat-containing protein [Pirellulaceae bacterium]
MDADICRLLLFAFVAELFLDGPAASRLVSAAELLYPLSVVADASGNIFVADRELPGIWKVADGALSLHFKGEKKFGTPLNAVRCLALDHEGKLLAGDSATREIYRFDAEGKPLQLTKGGIGIPIAIAVAKSGEIFVADLELHIIYKVAAAGGAPAEFSKVNAPRGMTIDAEDNLWIICHRDDLLIKLSPEAKKTVVVKGQPLTAPSFPAGVVVGKDGTAFIADGYNRAVWKVAAVG